LFAGIGLAILQNFAQKSSSDTFILGCRNPINGAATVEKLRALGITSKIDVLKLDVTSDENIKSAVEHVRCTYGRLDILINNAGISPSPKEDLSDIRTIFASTYDTNVFSVATIMSFFLPLMKETSKDARIINVGSTTSSFGQSDKFPVVPPQYASYISSKGALNMLTLCFGKAPGNQDVTFQVGGPGLCRTDLNEGARLRPGARDPLDGAKVYVELAVAEKGKFPNGFWYQGDEDEEPIAVPW
jgi:NAD(P)-dependent dehydrogenase (short-subunit alcohol dehydrogenase family)